MELLFLFGLAAAAARAGSGSSGGDSDYWRELERKQEAERRADWQRLTQSRCEPYDSSCNGHHTPGR